MLFPRVDVKECLLRNGSMKYARRVEHIEIDMTTARSAEALSQLERARSLSDRYMVDEARRWNSEAAATARRHKDGFVEAAALMSQTILMDGMTNSQSQTHFLGQALAALDSELEGHREQMLADRTPRAVAIVTMNPRMELRDLIVENNLQFQLRQDSLFLAETKTNADHHMGAGDWMKAANVARIGANNAVELFGVDHWWHAVMRVRLATALLRMQEVVAARQVVANTSSILDEWTDYDTRGVDVFKFERDMLSIAQHDIALMTA
jgi:hypothetical protein